MRRVAWGLALVAYAAIASASPPPRIAPADQAELTKLQVELAQLQSKQKHTEATKVARKLYALTLKAYGPDSPITHGRKQSLAGALTASADYSEARTLYLEALADAEKQHGPDSRQALIAVSELASNYTLQHRPDDAEPLYQRELDIVKKLDGETSVAYAMQLGQYATYLSSRNEYASAMRVYEQQYKLLSATAPNDMRLMGVTEALAMMYMANNDQARAVQFFDRAIHIVEATPQVKPVSFGAILNGIAVQYHMAGRDDLAAPLLKRQLEIYAPEIQRLESAQNDPNTLGSLLMQSAGVHVQLHDLATAEQEYQRSGELQKQTMGFSSSATQLAELYRRTGKLDQALALLEQVSHDMTAKFPTFTHTYDVSIANVMRGKGDYARAEQLLAADLTQIEKTHGRHDIMYGSTELMLAFVYMSAHDLERAERTLNDALELSEHDLQGVLKLGTEEDHAQYFTRNKYWLDVALNFNRAVAPKSAPAARLALTTIFRRKGRALDAAAGSIATIRSKLSPADKQLLDDLAEARAKLAQLTVTAPDKAGDAQYAKDVAALEDRIQKLELEVGKKSAVYRTINQRIDLPSVQHALPSRARLVEIINFQPADPNRYDPDAAPAPRRYLAYVLAATGDPIMVDLGEAQVIDDAVAKFRKAVSDPDNDRVTELGRALFDLTMAKIIPTLGGVTDVLLAPDGTLNVVPFSALVDAKGAFLVEHFTFTYLTSGRDLLRIHAKQGPHGGGVIFANPAFDVGGNPVADPAGGSRGARALELSQLTWPPLPGTGQEATAVAKTMPGWKTFVGEAATEAAVKAVHAPRILHIATHGFFLPDPPAPPAPPPDDTSDTAIALVSSPSSPTIDVYQNPLLRSGLAFAGANKLSSPSGDGDGILTAFEASGLDLEGTELVVLSACETGVGKVTNGDGVYGLRRALVIAGAQTLVMSLWQVDDEATKDLMVGYYARLARGKSRSAALRDTQLQLARGKYKHPYYWASFLPAGDDSPL